MTVTYTAASHQFRGKSNDNGNAALNPARLRMAATDADEVPILILRREHRARSDADVLGQGAFTKFERIDLA